LSKSKLSKKQAESRRCLVCLLCQRSNTFTVANMWPLTNKNHLQKTLRN